MLLSITPEDGRRWYCDPNKFSQEINHFFWSLKQLVRSATDSFINSLDSNLTTKRIFHLFILYFLENGYTDFL